MLLKRIELVGFKSFVERTVIELDAGITVIVGPNGCGKSNIIDAVRWVFGEQSPSSLRIAQQSELLFNGSKAQPAVNVAEVSIIFDNADDTLPLAGAEVAISRRLYRSGEAGYYLNGREAQLKDIRALFHNLGVGFSPYSILEQGKTDRMLLAKPEVRREIFEEAAGIRGHRVRFAESNRKLQRVERQMEAIRPTLQEIERGHHVKKEQWKQLQRYRQLSKEQTAVRIQYAAGEYQRLVAQRAQRAEHRDRLQTQYRAAAERNEQHRRESRQFQLQLEELRTAQQDNRNQIHEVQLMMERDKAKIGQHRERINQIEYNIAEHSRQMSTAFKNIESITTEQQQLAQQIEDGTRTLATLAQELKQQREERQLLTKRRVACIAAGKKCTENIAQYEGQQKRLRAKMTTLSQSIVQQLDRLFSERSDMSTDTIIDDPQVAVLSQKSAHFIERIVNLISDYRTIESGSVEAATQVIDGIEQTAHALQQQYREYCAARLAQLAVIEPLLTLLTDPESDFATRHRLDRQYSGIQDQIGGQRREIVLITAEQSELEQRLEALATHFTEETLRYERQKIQLQGVRERKDQFATQIETHKQERNRIHDLVSKHRDQQQEIKGEIKSLEQHLRERESGASERKTRERSLGEQITRIRKGIGSADQQSEKMQQRSQRLHSQLDGARDACSKVEVKMEVAERQFFEQFGSEVQAERAQGAVDMPALAQEIERLNKHIRQLGSINMMAGDEFAEIEARYRTMHNHYQDLIEAQRNLAQVTEHINRQSAAQLQQAVEKISGYFADICTHLFSESGGEIRLVEPDTPLDSDITVMIQPQGKKNEKIEHLSGGERALAALALLFSLYRHNPSYVAFFDEVDAALDEGNVVRVAHYIRDHLPSTQSIIITHNRQTISVATHIIGITMERYGISQALEIAVQDYLEK